MESEVQQQVDIDACLENLDHYLQAGDALSCRDIGIALARDLAAARDDLSQLSSEHATAVQFMRDAQRAGLAAIAERDRLRELAKWLVSLDEPGSADRQTVTLNQIITRAREALGKED
jgi:hypothetical protein